MVSPSYVCWFTPVQDEAVRDIYRKHRAAPCRTSILSHPSGWIILFHHPEKPWKIRTWWGLPVFPLHHSEVLIIQPFSIHLSPSSNRPSHTGETGEVWRSNTYETPIMFHFFGRFNIHMQTCTGHFDEFKTLEEINDRISVRDVSKPVLYHHSMYVGGWTSI